LNIVNHNINSMKSSIILLCLLATTAIFANAGEFSYDQNQVNASLEQLNVIERMHLAAPDKSLDQIKQEAGYASLSISSSTITSSGLAGDMPILPAFWWGCILSWVGILIVYLVTEDSDQTKSALWGCVLGTGIWIVFWLILGLAGSGIWWGW